MGRQMKAEREKRAVILEAEGRKEATFRDAEARERSAQAEAAASRIPSEAIAQGDIAALNSSIAEKYVRAFTALAQAPNQRTFIVPMELASLAGTLSGIAAIAGSAQGEARAEEAARVRRAIVPGSPARTAGPA
jgi:regulator of protease activity HflC (stomatin/prohibitin superfamily)